MESRRLALRGLPVGGRGSCHCRSRALVFFRGSLGLALRREVGTLGGSLLLALALLRLLCLVVQLREESATFAHDVPHKTGGEDQSLCVSP